MTITVPIEVSARHVHLSAEDWTKIFGQAQLTMDRPISQRPQYLARQRIRLEGPSGFLDRVAIVGPFRTATQVELANSDARRLGIRPPLAESGRLSTAVSVTIVGPRGSVTAPAAIISRRHLHASPQQAAEHGLQAGQEVDVRIPGSRGGILSHVVVRTDPSFDWSLHLDADEGNAFSVQPGEVAEVLRS